MSVRAARLTWPLLLGALLLSACGFRLAGSGQLAPELSPIYLQTRGFAADQLADLERRLRQAGARLSDQPDDAGSLLALRLESPPDARLIGSVGSRSVRRVERRLVFSLRRAGAEPGEEKVLVQRRELSFDEDNLLAADEQRAAAAAELEQALYNLLINQLLRR